MNGSQEIITYTDTIVFNYTLSEADGPEEIVREVTLAWEESLEEFFEQFGSEKGYEVVTFKNEREKEKFLNALDDENEKIIDEVDEEIAQKMKFSHVYTSPTYED